MVRTSNEVEKMILHGDWTSLKYILDQLENYEPVGGVLSAKITEDDKRNILYRNAETIQGKTGNSL